MPDFKAELHRDSFMPILVCSAQARSAAARETWLLLSANFQ
jgi:hypothetical protein